MNVLGLCGKNKRRDVFNFLKNENASIYFLQDTHSTDNETKNIYVYFGYTCYFSNNNSSSRGVATFIDNNIDLKFNSLLSDEEGNLLQHRIMNNTSVKSLKKIQTKREGSIS